MLAWCAQLFPGEPKHFAFEWEEAMVCHLCFPSCTLGKLSQLLCQGSWCPKDCVLEATYIYFSIILTSLLSESKSSVSAEKFVPWIIVDRLCTGREEKGLHCKGQMMHIHRAWSRGGCGGRYTEQTLSVCYKFEYWHCMCWVDSFQKSVLIRILFNSSTLITLCGWFHWRCHWWMFNQQKCVR